MSTLKVDGIRSNSATSDAITLASDGTCTANITNKPNRNLIINGSCIIAQRGVSATTSGYGSVDRYKNAFGGTDESPTQSQVDVASGTTPYTLGFRKAYRITNGNQTSGAGSGDYCSISYRLESQDIANSGWNYVSSSSNITLSFWVKSSVAQNFYGYLYANNNNRLRSFETGSLSANTWTKITKTISGDSNLVFNNDAAAGLQIQISQFWGTDYTDGSHSLNTWGALDNSSRTPNNTTTWYTTNDATFEITGLQLEVSDYVTDFEHRSFGQELALCTRYLQIFHVPSSDSYRATGITATVHGGGNGVYINTPFLPMRAAPSLTVDGAFGGNVFTGGWTGDTLSSFSAGFVTDPLSTYGFHGVTSATISSSRTTGLTGHIYTANNGSNDAALIYSAEL